MDIENLPSSIDFGHEEVVEKNNLRGETGGSASRESSDKESLDELIPESD